MRICAGFCDRAGGSTFGIRWTTGGLSGGLTRLTLTDLFTWTPLLLTNLLEEAGFVVGDARVVTHA